jgi:hypothetical protein
MHEVKDRLGETYGRLEVIARADNDEHGHAMWRCACQCGTETIVQGSSLGSGRALSCGCLRRETAAAIGRANRRWQYPQGTTRRKLIDAVYASFKPVVVNASA